MKRDMTHLTRRRIAPDARGEPVLTSAHPAQSLTPEDVLAELKAFLTALVRRTVGVAAEFRMLSGILRSHVRNAEVEASAKTTLRKQGLVS